MKNYFTNISKLPWLTHILFWALWRQKRFMQNSIVADLEKIKKTQDDSLEDKDFKKITDYYAYAVPAILGEAFCMLRGAPMNLRERTALTYLGGLTSLFDDFFDEKNTSEIQIKRFINKPGEQFGVNSHEQLFIKFYLKALENTPDKNLLKTYFNEVYQAQVKSKRQTLADIEREEIKEITLLKGGVSLLFYRSVLDNRASEEEKLMIYNLGSLFQVENDIFDIYKDHRDGIKTLATIETNINNLREFYTLLLEQMIDLLHQTEFPLKNKYRFLRYILLIICRGFVCLDFLEMNESTTNNRFNIQDYSRKDLICDMEKTRSQIKLVQYYANSNVH